MEYTTHITFISGDKHKEDPIPKEKIPSTIKRLTEGPASMMGIIKRVIIVDSMDCICVEIVGRDITHPVELVKMQKEYRNRKENNDEN